MASESHTHLHRDVRWNRGPAAGALYDLRDGRVHQVSATFAAAIDEHFASGKPLPELLNTPSGQMFVHQLQESGLMDKAWEHSHPKVLEIRNNLSPKLLWLEVTGRCNYTCKHCYAESDPQPRASLPTNRWISIIDEAAEQGFSALQFTGGDPLMHADILQLIERASMQSFELVEVYTNGSMLTDKVLDFFAERGVQIAMSFYSDRADIYEQITRSNHMFDKAVAGIRGAIARNIPIRIGVIEMQENGDHIEETIAFLIDLGVEKDAIQVDGVRPSGRGNTLQPTTCGGSVGQLVSLERLMPESQPPIWRAPMPLPKTFKLADSVAEWNNCWAGELVIDPDGNVFPCIFTRVAPLGNVAQLPLASVIQSEPVSQTWQTTLGDCVDCAVCEYRFACFDCRALTVNVTGNQQAKPPSCIYNPHKGTRDWHRWIKQIPDYDKWMSQKPAKIVDFYVQEQTSDSVLLIAEDESWRAEVSYIVAALLDAATGAETIQDIVSATVGVWPGEAHEMEHIAAATYLELQEQGMIAFARTS